jgi:hypothetical protein
MRELVLDDLELLQADDVGLPVGEPLRQALRPRSDTVHVPRGEKHIAS